MIRNILAISLSLGALLGLSDQAEGKVNKQLESDLAYILAGEAVLKLGNEVIPGADLSRTESCTAAQMMTKSFIAFDFDSESNGVSQSQHATRKAEIQEQLADYKENGLQNLYREAGVSCEIPVSRDLEDKLQFNLDIAVASWELLDIARQERNSSLNDCVVHGIMWGMTSALSNVHFAMLSDSLADSAFAAQSVLNAMNGLDTESCAGLESERCCKRWRGGIEGCVISQTTTNRCSQSQANPDECHRNSTQCSGGNF